MSFIIIGKLEQDSFGLEDYDDRMYAAEATDVPLYQKHAIDEDTKIRLAIGVSMAFVPGAVTANPAMRKAVEQKAPALTGIEWSYEQILTKRPASSVIDNQRMPPDEELPLDELQSRMAALQDEVARLDKREAQENAKERRQRRQNCALCLTASTFIIVAMTVAWIVLRVVSVQNEGEGSDEHLTAKQFQECLMDNQYTSAQFRAIQSFLLEETLFEPRSYQRAALCWLSEVDRTYTAALTSESQETVLQTNQRFVLACIYYHWIPPGSLQNPGLNWLSDVPTCDWDFVMCNDLENRLLGLSITGTPLKNSIPKELARLPDLVNLVLSDCHLSGTIPTELLDLTKLEVLDLSSNALTGTIPSTIGSSLLAARRIELSDNLLSGTIPPELFHLTRLEALHLAFNNLTGEISLDGTELGQLQSLVLSSNRLTGQLPPHVFHLPKLTKLLLGVNHFTGSLPHTMGHATSLKVLSLGPNSLTGTIPEISPLRNLTFLDFHDTLFENSFPNISTLTNLEYLNFDDVAMSGTLPSMLWVLPKLKSVFLVNTRLKGTIPAEIGLLTSGGHLDLQGSLLSGSVPTELGNLAYLQYLDLGNLPDLTGMFPSELGQLSKLSHLVLPLQSKVSGTVPLEICHLLSGPHSTLKQIYGPSPPQCDCCTAQL